MSRLSWQSPKDFFEDLWGTWEDLSRPEKHKPEVAVISFFFVDGVVLPVGKYFHYFRFVLIYNQLFNDVVMILMLFYDNNYKF